MSRKHWAALIVFALIGPIPLIGQARKIMVVADNRGNEVEVTKWVVRPAKGKPGALEVEQGKGKVSYSLDKISKVTVSKTAPGLTPAAQSCHVTITLTKGGEPVGATLRYQSYFLEGILKNGTRFSMDICLASSVTFKD